MPKIFRIFLLLIGIILILNSCRSLSVSYIPDMQSSIAYEQFHQQAIQLLIAEPINLKIDTAYQDMIVASETYEGKLRRKNLFWKTRWQERVVYFIRYSPNQLGVSYSLEIKAQEIPRENSILRRTVHPSRATKEDFIIQKLSNHE